MTELTHKKVFQWMEEWAPKNLAYDWDPVGLQVGNDYDVVKNILVTLDVTEAVVNEAIKNNVNLIISHHPVLFQAIQSINTATSQGKLLKAILKNDITVYTAHTNLDIAQGGVNDILAQLLQLQNIKPVADINHESLYKIVVFVPESHADCVRHALSTGGAGHIGKYSHCTFQAIGEGTFKPLEGTNPYIGEKGTIEYVPEYKIESIVPQAKLPNALEQMIHAHPYEEVAYDVYPLDNQGEQYGLGRMGSLTEKQTLETFIKYVKDAYQLNNVRITGDLQKSIKHVAIIGGSGEKYIPTAKRAGVDLLITGDVTFHQAQLAENIGLAVIDAGHYIEHLAVGKMQQYLQDKLQSKTIHVHHSTVNTDPFQYV